MTLNPRSATFFLISVLTVVFVSDIITKHIIFEKIKTEEKAEIIIIKDWLYLRCVTNKGVIWGFFSNSGTIFTYTTILLLIFVCYLYYNLKDFTIVTTISFGLISGGGLGNLYDRLFLGYVRDFIDFRKINWPVFNLADSFICIGTILLLMRILFTKDFLSKQKEKQDLKK